ncbi:MAG TPA: BON domain-containing protein [Nitrospirales bacterium]|nr:BON domain-containing protein [Nitrospirales bacterium]
MRIKDPVLRNTPITLTATFQLALLIFCGLVLIGQQRALGKEQKTVIPDQDISRAVESALLLDENIPSHLIDVRTDQGIVTLIGVMPHYRAKDRAAKIVETVKGVASVINGLTVKISNKTDKEIRENVQKALQDDPATDSYGIDVAVEHGTVTLTGTVPSWAARELSEWVATGVHGVREIQNNLFIDLKEKRSDDVILDEIQKRLEADVWVNEDAVLVSVNNAEVKLDGIVGSIAEKRRVLSDARVAGVREVDDDLLFVKAWAKGQMRRQGQPGYKSDEEIKETLILAYAYDPRVAVFNPTIDVRHGMVTLTGTVDNLKAKQSAEEVAKYTRGVVWVKNLLKVRPKEPVDDEALARKVEMALHEDPFIDRFQVIMTVHNGIVVLRGSVGSQFQKDQAQDTVSRVKGVVDVKNKLQVDEIWTWKPDIAIQREIENELWWSPFVDSDDITVSVKAGVATLSGTVDNYFEYEAALENAREGGARRVESLLTIRRYLNFDILPDIPL